MLQKDGRWKYGVPPVGSANFAWVQHFIYHLAPNGIAGFVLSNVSLSSTSSGEDEIRKNIIQNDLVDCIITLPENYFITLEYLPAFGLLIVTNKIKIFDKKEKKTRYC